MRIVHSNLAVHRSQRLSRDVYKNRLPVAPRRSRRLAAENSHTITNPRAARPVPLVGDTHPHKRERTKRNLGNQPTKRRSRNLHLDKLLHMPLDVVFEILGHLHPLDLLNLARTTKLLRNVLMHRSATGVWKQARSHSSELPDCPSDLSEPKYASLMFDTHCHFCLSTPVKTVMWNHRIRCCKKCLNIRFAPVHNFWDGQVLGFPIETILPCDVVDYIMYTTRTECDQLLAILRQSDPDERAACLQQRFALEAERKKTADEMGDWLHQQSQLRAQDLKEMCTRRKNAIMNELRKLGYGEDLDGMDRRYRQSLETHHLVRQRKELTPRIWNNIKDALVTLVKEIKQEKLFNERFDRLVTYAQSLTRIIDKWKFQQPCADVLPHPVDYCSMPEIQAIVDKCRANSSTRLNDEEIIGILPMLTSRWFQAKAHQIVHLISGPKETSEMDELDLSPLCLATAWFYCKSCNGHIRFPSILVHPCTNTLDYVGHSRELTLQSAIRYNSWYHVSSWHLPKQGLVYDVDTALRVQKIVETCGKDPTTTTAREMDDLDARFVCQESKDSDMDVIVVSRRAALLYPCESSTSAWIALDQWDTDAMKVAEGKNLEGFEDSEILPLWECSWCFNQQTMTFHSMTKHLDLYHGNTLPRTHKYHLETGSPPPEHARPVSMPLDQLKGLGRALRQIA